MAQVAVASAPSVAGFRQRSPASGNWSHSSAIAVAVVSTREGYSLSLDAMELQILLRIREAQLKRMIADTVTDVVFPSSREVH